MADKSPTSELGQATQASGVPGIISWSAMAGDEMEQNPKLQWPNSVWTYSMMRTDAQVDGLHRGSTLPLRRYSWLLDPQGARPEVTGPLAEDLGLSMLGEDDPAPPRLRNRNRFKWGQHLFHVLMAMQYGHMYFEQVGEVRDMLWRLKKLAPRMPESLAEINVEKDGGLKSIKQNLGWNAPEIPVDRLIAYVFEQEGANWVGRSMMRACYFDWLAKDRLKRINIINIERGGGIPWVETTDKGTNPGELKSMSDMARSFKPGTDSGGALPPGAKLHMERPAGTSAVDSIRLHNQEMATAYLMMFIELGTTETGSRALGSEFIDFFALAQTGIADWVCEVFNEHMIEDWVDWNFGEGEEAPALTYVRNEDPSLSVQDLIALVDKGVITLDPEIEGFVRKRYKLPSKSEESPPPSPPVDDDQLKAVERQRRSVEAAAVTSPLSLPDRPLRREPTEAEIAAQVDFAAIDAVHTDEVAAMVGDWKGVQSKQIDSLSDQIAKAGGDLERLSGLAVEADGALIAERMKSVAATGAQQVVDEAKRQGLKISTPNLDDLVGALESRASATASLLSRSISEAGARQAITRTGGALSAAEVAAEVKTYLLGLSDAYLTERFTGVLTAALNSGRKATMRAEPPKAIYASELLDEATCEECEAIDGTDYDTVEEAEADYPTGGYMNCLGGERCRGTLIAVYEEQT